MRDEDKDDGSLRYSTTRLPNTLVIKEILEKNKLLGILRELESCTRLDKLNIGLDILSHGMSHGTGITPV
jgi:hypothetical protein